jgi:hypothetical protein
VGQQREQPGAPSRASALHRALRDGEHRGGLGDRVALHVDQHERGALLGWQRGQRPQQLAVEFLAFGGGFRGHVRFEMRL